MISKQFWNQVTEGTSSWSGVIPFQQLRESPHIRWDSGTLCVPTQTWLTESTRVQRCLCAGCSHSQQGPVRLLHHGKSTCTAALLLKPEKNPDMLPLPLKTSTASEHVHSETVIALVIGSYLSTTLRICSRFQQLLWFYYLVPTTFHQHAAAACIIHAVYPSSMFSVLRRNDVSKKP